jgi:hypothetical protein
MTKPIKTQIAKPKQSERKAWSEKIAAKEKRGEQREKRKLIRDKLRLEREAQREKEHGEEDEQEEQDWKELRRERKRINLGTTQRNGNVGVEFDL